MIRYAIGGELSEYTSCYASIMGKMFPSKYSHDSFKQDNIYFDAFVADKFTGITLYVSSEAVARDFPNDTSDNQWGSTELMLDKCDDDYIRDMLHIARAVGFGEYVPSTITKLKADGYVHFSPDVPFYIVVAVTGFFRAWDGNHSELHSAYKMLVKKGLDPYTAFCGAQSLSNHDEDEWFIYYAGEHSIVPYCIFNKSGVSQFKTWEERKSQLSSMKEDLTTNRYLDYHDRDEWFGAMFSGNSVDTDELDEDEIYNCCVTSKHLIGVDYPDCYETCYVDVDSLIEEVKQW